MIVGLVIVACWVLVAICAPLIAPHDPLAQDFAITAGAVRARTCSAPTSSAATSSAACSYGARAVAAARRPAGGSERLIGTMLGVVAGYFGGWVDGVIMRLADLVFAFPAIVLAMVVTASLGPSRATRCSRWSSSSWPIYARVVRALVLSIGQSEYVQAFRLLGASASRAMRKEVLPQRRRARSSCSRRSTWPTRSCCWPALSFLGLGAQPPTAEWGSMVSVGTQYFQNWWMATFPGLAIFTAVLALQLHRRRRCATCSTRSQLRRATEEDAVMTALLEVEHLVVRAADRATGCVTVVDGVDLAVEAGQVFGIAGESGSGKTHDRARRCWACCRRGGVATGPALLRRARRSARLRGRRAARSAGSEHLDGLPGPDDLAAPDAHASAAQLTEHAAPPPEARQARGPRARRRRCSTTSASPTARPRCAPTRTSSPAACASGSRSRSR